MAYSVPWDETEPAGATTPAADIDEELQELKVSIRERMNDLVGAGNWENDAVEPKVINQGIYVNVDGSVSGLGPAPTKVTGLASTDDPNSMYDGPNNNVVLPTDGIYLIMVRYQAQLLAGVDVNFQIRVNDVTILNSSGAGNVQPSSGAADIPGTVFAATALQATDTVQIYGSDSSSAALIFVTWTVVRLS